MERRGFIKGMLAAVAGATATVKLAEPGEAEALIAQRNVLLAQPEPADYNAAVEAITSNFQVYAKLGGKFVPIGYIQSLEVTSARVDSLYTYDGVIRGTNHQFVEGLKQIMVHFQGPNL